MMPPERIKALKEMLVVDNLDALMITAVDEHLNEYVPLHKRRLEAITGFTGSAGTLILMCEGPSSLFVDSRYHLQAELECGALLEIQKLGLHGVYEAHEWLAYKDVRPLRIGIDPYTITPKQWYHFE